MSKDRIPCWKKRGTTEHSHFYIVVHTSSLHILPQATPVQSNRSEDPVKPPTSVDVNWIVRVELSTGVDSRLALATGRDDVFSDPGGGGKLAAGAFGCCCGDGSGTFSTGSFYCCGGHKAGGGFWFSLPESLLKGRLLTAETRTLIP